MKTTCARSHRHEVRTRRFGVPLALALSISATAVLAGCDGTGDPTRAPAPGELAVQFSVASGDAQGSSPAVAPSTASIRQEDGALFVEGTNGTLEITGIWMVVDEFELEGESGTPDFESGPFFVELKLDGTSVAVTSGPVPPGRYDELEFELDNPGDDLLAGEVRELFPDWPPDATMRVTGNFTPSFDPTERAFEVYLEAEVELELDFAPPLEIEETEGTVAVVTIAPGLWFVRGDGSVVELSRWDHRFGDRELQELEVEIKDGFLKVDWDR